MLHRAGLKEVRCSPRPNLDHEEKRGYSAALAAVREREHDRTPCVTCALNGITIQGTRLTRKLKTTHSKELFRNLMNELFARQESTRRQVIVKCQRVALNRLHERDGGIAWLKRVAEVREH